MCTSGAEAPFLFGLIGTAEAVPLTPGLRCGDVVEVDGILQGLKPPFFCARSAWAKAHAYYLDQNQRHVRGKWDGHAQPR